MNKRNQKVKASKHPSKMVFNAFSPVGAPGAPGRERYFFSLPGLEAMLGKIGGENDAR